MSVEIVKGFCGDSRRFFGGCARSCKDGGLCSWTVSASSSGDPLFVDNVFNELGSVKLVLVVVMAKVPTAAVSTDSAITAIALVDPVFGVSKSLPL